MLKLNFFSSVLFIYTVAHAYGWEPNKTVEVPAPEHCSTYDGKYEQTSLMQVKPNTKTAFQSEATPCPTTGECAARKKAYLVAGDAVFASAEKSGFRCAYYGDAKGNLVAGFLRSQDLAEFKEDRVPLTQDFLKGKWKNEDNDLTFAERKPGFMHLTGHAQWSNGETTHEGEVNAEGKINGNQTFFREGLDEETDCTIRVIRRGPYLILGDNSLCGGVNVRFSGIYVKVHR